MKDAPKTMSASLRPLVFDDLHIGFPIVQAALSGYSDWPMRMMARRFGAAYTLCEVMLDQFLLSVKERKRTQHFLYTTPGERPVGGQLMGADPQQFAAGAQRLVQAGFNVVDINFGCPVKKVLGRCRGGFHLGQPDVAIEIIRRTRDATPPSIPVTVKMRRGIDDTAASRDRFFEILDGAFAAGAAAVTVHGRTVTQRYRGRSNWGFLKEVKQYLGERTLLGSGDLFTARDCLDMIAQTGVDGVTVARGAIGNPWIFQQALALARGAALPPPPSLHEQRDVLLEHLTMSRQIYGERCGVLMRKFAIKYSAQHPDHAVVRADFARARSEEQWNAVLQKHYAVDLPGQYPPLEIHETNNGCT